MRDDMNEKYVVSLDLAKRMRELGFEQKSDYYWSDWYCGVLRFGEKEELFRGEWRIVSMPPHNDDTKISAYHVGELGEMLPLRSISWEWNVTINKLFINLGWQWCVNFTSNYGGNDNKMLLVADISADTQANAIAKMLVYLAENNLITPPNKVDK